MSAQFDEDLTDRSLRVGSTAEMGISHRRAAPSGGVRVIGIVYRHTLLWQRHIGRRLRPSRLLALIGPASTLATRLDAELLWVAFYLTALKRLDALPLPCQVQHAL